MKWRRWSGTVPRCAHDPPPLVGLGCVDGDPSGLHGYGVALLNRRRVPACVPVQAGEVRAGGGAGAGWSAMSAKPRFVLDRYPRKSGIWPTWPTPVPIDWRTVLRDTVTGEEMEDPSPLQAIVFIGNALATKGGEP